MYILTKLNICLLVFMIVDIQKVCSRFFTEEIEAAKKKNLVKSITDDSNSEHFRRKDFVQEYPFKMESFLQSLESLKLQENHKRKKKSLNINEKRMQVSEMRNKIQDLMSNISRTLDDVDWYFAYEQPENQRRKLKEFSDYKPTQKLVIKRMRRVDDLNSDIFVNSFIQQMYDMDPSLLGKIRDRIQKEFSNSKREMRFVSPAKSMKKKTKIEAITINEDEPYDYNDENIFYNDLLLTKIPDRLCNVPDYLSDVNNILKQQDARNLLTNDIDYVDMHCTTTPSTTFENFYDYGDYYKENDDDKLNDIAHYEIIQDILQSTSGYREYTSDFKKFGIKNKFKKTRHFDKSRYNYKKIV